MSVRDHVYELTTVSEVREFIRGLSVCSIFKAECCGKSDQALEKIQSALEDFNLPLSIGIIDVKECKEASDEIAKLTGIQHAAPQFIVFVEEQAVFNLSGAMITEEAVGDFLEESFEMEEEEQQGCGGHCACHGDDDEDEDDDDCDIGIEPFRNLLNEFLDGALTESEFKHEWQALFQNEETRPSEEEMALWGPFFEDVNAALSGKSAKSGGCCKSHKPHTHGNSNILYDLS